MKIIKYVLLILLVFVIGFSIYIAVQPNSYEVTRTKIIEAPQPVVYNTVNDFETWQSWSAWIEEKPETVLTLSDKTSGVGAVYQFEEEDGIGTMTTTATQPSNSISQEMKFGDYPKSNVQWNFEPTDDGATKVTWTMSGSDLPFGFKLFSTLMGGMESQIGPKFERGLVKLDSVVHAQMKVYSIDVKGVTQHSGGYYIYNTTSSKISELQESMSKILPKVGAYAMTHNVTMAGPVFVLYHKWDKENDAVIFSSCVPTNTKITTDDPDILTGQLDTFKAVKTVLKGDYDNLKEAWDATMKYIDDNNLEATENGPMLETYLTDPMRQPNPAKWVTEIYVAIK